MALANLRGDFEPGTPGYHTPAQARTRLVDLTGQDFGPDPERWASWLDSDADFVITGGSEQLDRMYKAARQAEREIAARKQALASDSDQTIEFSDQIAHELGRESSVPQTLYHTVHSESPIVLRGDTTTVLEETRQFVENVNDPMRDEVLRQISSMEKSLLDSIDCDLTEQKWCLLLNVFLDLFESGAVEMITKDQIYSSETVKKEAYSTFDGVCSGHLGFHYKTADGQIVFTQTTGIS